MWNNYTVHLLNPDRIATRQAEANAVRLADEARQVPDERHARSELTSWATTGIEQVVARGTLHAAVVRTRAARHRAAVAATRVQHVHRPHLAIGHHRA